MRSHMRLIGASIAALFIPLVLPLATNRVFVFDDLGQLHLPLRYLYSEALRNGTSLLWSPAFFSGFYLHGEGQAGMAHPLHLLLYRFLPIGPAFNLEILTIYVALLFGTERLFKRLGLSREAAWFGAAAFTFSGFTLLRLVHINIVAAVAHLPWLLLAADILLTSDDARSRSRAFGLTAGLVASESLVGHPQAVWMTLLAVLYWTLCRVGGGAARGRMFLLGGALAAGLMMGGIQWLPTADALRSSERAVISPDDRLTYSLGLPHLLFFWAPQVFRLELHELSVYDGAFSMLALVWIALRWPGLTHRQLVLALAGLAILGLILALGSSGYVYPWLSRLPGLAGFRAPARYVVLIHCALAGIAAIAFDDLRRASIRGTNVPWTRAWWLALPLALNLLTVVVAAVRARQMIPDSLWQDLVVSWPLRTNLAYAWPWTLVLALATALMILAARGRAWAVPCLVVVALFDLGLWGFAYAYGVDGERVTAIESLAGRAGVPPEARPGDLLSGIRDMANLVVFSGQRHDTGGTIGLIPARRLDTAERAVQRVAGVRWRLDDGRWRRVEDSMARARLVSSVEVTSNVAADLRRIDILRTALVDAPLPLLAGDAGIVQSVIDRPGRITVETVSIGAQLLVVTERFHEGWRATEDGVARPVVRAYGDFMALVVTAGEHRVEFSFEPASFRRGAWASLFGLALTLGCVWGIRRPRTLK